VSNDVWLSSLDHLREQLPVQVFDTWLKPIHLISANVNHIELEVPNKFFRDWVNENYLTAIHDALFEVSQKEFIIELRVSQSTEPPLRRELPEIRKEKFEQHRLMQYNLVAKYTFETFLVGSSNQFAHAAALAVANMPGKTYNPLFIYGGVGLGKTHLLNAIGHKILQCQPTSRPCLVSSERFTNELINSIRYEKVAEFREKYRASCDLLLIDDIQFIAGKERTQEEFFHTFNTLYESHKQIVIMSDKLPKDMPGFEERLRSRFEWGLVADVQPPEMETKVAILKKKAEDERIPLPNDVAIYLASHVETNVRELEGSLIRIGAFASLTGREINLDLAKEALQNTLRTQPQPFTVEKIQRQVAHFFNISVNDLKSDRKIRFITKPRQIAMYLCRTLTPASFPEIGEKFGGKDHSTVIHAVRKVEQGVKEDLQLKTDIEAIQKTI
jgi:chromosomal replication initiator protein